MIKKKKTVKEVWRRLVEELIIKTKVPQEYYSNFI